MIELHRICAGYGKTPVLTDVSATIEAGKLTSIIGVNGCGKSTLLKAILGILPLSGGRITIDGADLAGMSRTQVARRVAYLSQGKSTPDMTVEQLVLHGRFPHLRYPRRYTSRDRQIAREAMEQVGIAEFMHSPLAALSGGMRQNVYIAMALAQGTDYVLLDEPTTYLDIGHQLELMKILRSLADNGKGIAAVMHDLPMAFTFSDRIILVGDGTILYSGNPETLCKSPALEQIFSITLHRSADGRSFHYQY